MTRGLPALLLATILGIGASLPLRASDLSAPQATELLKRAANAAAEGDPATAARIWNELLPWVRRHAPIGSAMLPQSLLQLGATQHNLGKLPQAMASYQEALDLARALQPPRPTLVAALLNNQADVEADLEHFAQARFLLEESLALKTAALGPDHLEVGIGHSNLGDLLRDLGEWDAAHDQLERSLAVLEPLAAAHPLALAAALNNTSRLHQSRGHWDQARQALEQAQQLRIRALPPTHPDLALGWNNLGMLALSRGDLNTARRELDRAHTQAQKLYGNDHHLTALQLANLGRLAADLDQLDQAEQKLEQAQAVFDHQLGSTHPSSLNNLAELLLVAHRRGRSAEHRTSLDRLLRNRFALFSNEAWRLAPREQLLLLRRRDLSWYLADALATTHPEAAQLALALRLNTQGLLQEIQRAGLLGASAPQRTAQRRWLEPSEVAAALPVSAVLIEIRRYLDPANLPRDPTAPLPWNYRAYVLRPDKRVAIVELGPAAELEPRIRLAYLASAQQLDDAAERWDAVSKALIRPLQAVTGTAQEWFIVPDAGLHQIPFQALAPERRIRLLSTGRDLIRPHQPAQRMPTISVVAGHPRIPNDLPATEAELADVGQLLGVKPVQGAAFNAAMLRSVTSPRVLHLATHGFWDEGSTRPGRDPMLRSGLIVSPAENKQGALNGERFTAADFLETDLFGTELVTLAACSTGLGDLHDSEGIYGLQRGVQVAGARSVLTSLWPVEDEATRDWMLRYYRRLISGMGRADALAAVQEEFRQHPNTDWRHPYFWAGWQLVGDWRPIEGL